MSSFGNLFAMKNQAQGGTGLAGIPTWKLLAASALSNIGKPGTGLNPIQLIMAQRDAQQEQEKQQNIVQIAQLGKWDQNAGTAINPLLGRPSPQMAQSPQSKLGAMAATNPLVAQALATQNLQDLMGGGGFTGTLKPGETAFDQGRIVASMPAEPPKDPAKVQEYNLAKQQGYQGTFYDYQRELAAAGKSSTNVNVNTAEGISSGLMRALPQRLEKDAEAAQAAANLYQQTATVEKLLDSGVITGTMANPRLAITKAFATAGLIEGESVANTEAFITQVGQNVLQLVKGLGAGSGISNADLKFAERIAAGDIELSEKSIRKAFELQKKASEAKIKSYNDRYKRTFENPDIDQSLLDPYRVQLPQVSQPTSETSRPSNVPANAQKAPDGNWYSPDPNRPGKYLKW